LSPGELESPFGGAAVFIRSLPRQPEESFDTAGAHPPRWSSDQTKISSLPS
jgi:hypothetical protein